MTVSQLRKALKGINGKMEVYLCDHDHGTYEYNGKLGCVMKVNQKDNKNEYRTKQDDEIFTAKGTYLTLRVG